MKFKDYKYVRPNIEEICKTLEELTEVIKNAKEVDIIVDSINKINKMFSEYSTQGNLAFIRNSIDTTDAFYEAEIE